MPDDPCPECLTLPTVAALIAVLQRLEPGDRLEKNTVGNLIVHRGSQHNYAWVNLRFPEIDLFGDDSHHKGG
jgi:hypothetical protein